MYNFQRVEVFPASWLHSQRVADRVLRMLWLASASIGCAALLLLLVVSVASTSSTLTAIAATLTSPFVFVPALISSALFVLAYRRYRRRQQQLTRAFHAKLDALESVLNDAQASHALREQAAFALARMHADVGARVIRTAAARIEAAHLGQQTNTEADAPDLHLREAYLEALWVTHGVPSGVIHALQHVAETPVLVQDEAASAESQERAYRAHLAVEAALILNRQRRARLRIPAPIGTLEEDRLLASQIAETVHLLRQSAPSRNWSRELLAEDPLDVTHLALGGH